jgi:hypothetical protein
MMHKRNNNNKKKIYIYIRDKILIAFYILF